MQLLLILFSQLELFRPAVMIPGDAYSASFASLHAPSYTLIGWTPDRTEQTQVSTEGEKRQESTSEPVNHGNQTSASFKCVHKLCVTKVHS